MAGALGDVTANIDPEAWRISDGRLYLNHDKGAADEIKTTPGQLDRVDANSPTVRDRILVDGTAD